MHYGIRKKDIIRTIRTFKKTLNKGISKTVWSSSYWDIHEKQYTAHEVAARFLRIKGYDVQIDISDNTECPSYLFGYIRFHRHVRISFNQYKKQKL